MAPDSCLVEEERKFVTPRTTASAQGKMAFEVTYRGKKTVLLPEQIVAAFLHKLHLIM